MKLWCKTRRPGVHQVKPYLSPGTPGENGR
uniref:Uncharacterized protein n=1 Tax=Anguilla anguilla TaxID=7936 RepID=A0A0E9PNR9_ANGAN